MSSESISTHKQCQGFKLTLPPGRTPHSSYPFGLHDHLHDPWDYSVTNGILVLHSRKCTQGVTLDSMGHCQYCEMLAKDANIQGILRRMEIGVLENAILAYHSIGWISMNMLQNRHTTHRITQRRMNCVVFCYGGWVVHKLQESLTMH